MAEKTARRAFFAQNMLRHGLDIACPGLDGIDLGGVDIKAHYCETGLGNADGQRQADIAEADHRCLGAAGLDGGQQFGGNGMMGHGGIKLRRRFQYRLQLRFA
ncbi:hypothetical protein RvVAT039_12010 [Agrobacterium vitis]|nr:hypothetical protein RvVAT039_12010 [Agrobacterium vitis]